MEKKLWKKVVCGIGISSLFLATSIASPVEASENSEDIAVNHQTDTKELSLNSSVNRKHHVIHVDMPPDWNPPQTRYFVRGNYAGTLNHVGSATVDGKIKAVYSGYLYEQQGGYNPMSAEK